MLEIDARDLDVERVNEEEKKTTTKPTKEKKPHNSFRFFSSSTHTRSLFIFDNKRKTTRTPCSRRSRSSTARRCRPFPWTRQAVVVADSPVLRSSAVAAALCRSRRRHRLSRRPRRRSSRRPTSSRRLRSRRRPARSSLRSRRARRRCPRSLVVPTSSHLRNLPPTSRLLRATTFLRMPRCAPLRRRSSTTCPKVDGRAASPSSWERTCSRAAPWRRCRFRKV